MRRWQVGFFGRPGQLVFWILVAVVVGGRRSRRRRCRVMAELVPWDWVMGHLRYLMLYLATGVGAALVPRVWRDQSAPW